MDLAHHSQALTPARPGPLVIFPLTEPHPGCTFGPIHPKKLESARCLFLLNHYLETLLLAWYRLIAQMTDCRPSVVQSGGQTLYPTWGGVAALRWSVALVSLCSSRHALHQCILITGRQQRKAGGRSIAAALCIHRRATPSHSISFEMLHVHLITYFHNCEIESRATNHKQGSWSQRSGGNGSSQALSQPLSDRDWVVGDL